MKFVWKFLQVHFKGKISSEYISFIVCQNLHEYLDIALQNIHPDKSYLVPEAFLETGLRIESCRQESLRKAILFRKQLTA